MIFIDDIVYPKTTAGLYLADIPVNGLEKQKLNSVCILRGAGKVIDVNEVIIDYDDWTNVAVHGIKLGKVRYRSCLVKCSDGKVGWAGEGALIKK